MHYERTPCIHNDMNKTVNTKNSKLSLFGLLKNYRSWVVVLMILTIGGNGANLVLPKIISYGIDSFTKGTVVIGTIAGEFFVASLFIFICAYFQGIVQTLVSERVAKDLRERLTDAISRQSYSAIERISPSQLLTNLTSDVDAVKAFVSQAIPTIVSSLVLIVGTSVLLLMINWRLALGVLTLIPTIGLTFFFVMRKVSALFGKSQSVIDWLNKVINESVLGAALIRVLNSAMSEEKKFIAANIKARDVGLQILTLFSGMIPLITLVANMATLVILNLGGHFVIMGTMSLGDFAAFNTYLIIFIFPLIMLGFMGDVMARSMASYARVSHLLTIQKEQEMGGVKDTLHGDIEVHHLWVTYGEKQILKDISFTIKGGSRTAIIGPTAAGKTQLLYVLTGLLAPTSGSVKYDGRDLNEYDKTALYTQIGFVFQDSIMFNMTIEENIAFNTAVTDADLEKAIQTAELGDFIDSLPLKLKTLISERGTSLSGGQKQRIMLARALAQNPKILLLDDFTARVDTNTERHILENVQKNYSGITLLSVTQKIAPVEDYDQIILLMEGEILGQGTHETLMNTVPEYVQIFNSQKSTNRYEVRT